MSTSRVLGIATPWNRVSALALSLLLTALLGIAVLTLGQTRAPPRVEARSIATFDVVGQAVSIIKSSRPKALKQPAPSPAPPILVSLTVEPSQPPSEPVMAVLAEGGQTTSAGSACDLSGPVQSALQVSPEVEAALLTIPTAQRSVANAIMLWDGTWRNTSDPLAKAVLQVVRDVIADSSATSGDDCRLQPQVGPRLFYLAGGATTTVLVMGSGQWRWQDVIDTPLDGDARNAPALAMSAAPPSSSSVIERHKFPNYTANN